MEHTQEVRTYRINAGSHSGPDHTGKTKHIVAGRPGVPSANDTITTHQDLLLLNGDPPMSPKFTLIAGGVPLDEVSLLAERERIDKQLAMLRENPATNAVQKAAEKGGAVLISFEKMTVEQLREWAEDQEIEIGDEADKDALIAIIRKATA